MTVRPLAETLLEVLDALRPPAGVGLVVTEAEVQLPLELWTAVHRGRPIIVGSAPHTRWASGVLPPVHATRLHLVLVEDEEGRPRAE